MDGLGTDHVGTYRSAEERDKIYIKEINGMKNSLLSYTYGTNGIHVPEDWLVNRLDENLIKKRYSKGKSSNRTFIVVMPHMGKRIRGICKRYFLKIRRI